MAECKIKGAIFDMDGTLVDSLFFWDQFWLDLNRDFIKRDGFFVDRDVDKKIRTMVFTDALEHIKQFYGITASTAEMLEYSQKRLEHFYLYSARVKTGAFALLDYLKACGVKLCLASATSKKHVILALETHGLMPYFDCVLSCADIGAGKDKPDIYLKAVDMLALSPDECCVFEDSFVALETAKSIGCQTAGIFDKNNFCQDRLENASSVYYVKEGEPLDALIGNLEK